MTFRLLPLLFCGLVACGDADNGPDAGTEGPGAGQEDAGGRPRPVPDGGDVPPLPDGGGLPSEADTAGSSDAPQPPADGETEDPDAGVPDAEDIAPNDASPAEDADDGDHDTVAPDAAEPPDAPPPAPDVVEEPWESVGEPPEALQFKTFACPRRWADSPIRITEIMINPNNGEGQATATEWFEITNLGAAVVELEGGTVRDDDTDEFIINAADRLDFEGFYQDPLRTGIDPGEYLTFYQRALGDRDCRSLADPECKIYFGDHFYVFRRDNGMALGNSGDEVVLVDQRGRILDCIVYASADDVDGRSWQRVPTEDGTGFTDQWCLTQLTEPLRYNDNAQAPRRGDYGGPGRPYRCW